MQERKIEGIIITYTKEKKKRGRNTVETGRWILRIQKKRPVYYSDYYRGLKAFATATKEVRRIQNEEIFNCARS